MSFINFLSICRIFREEPSLVHQYSLRILLELLKGLKSGGSPGTLQVRKQNENESVQLRFLIELFY